MGVKDLLPMPFTRRSVSRRSEDQKNLFSSLQQEMNKMFDRFFDDFRPGLFEDKYQQNIPRTDVTETESEVHVTVDIPGIEKKDLEISISDDTILIQGEKHEESEKKEGSFYHRERSFGSFRREIVLPTEVDGEKADASLKNGVLKIRIPVKESAQRKTRKIEIKTD